MMELREQIKGTIDYYKNLVEQISDLKKRNSLVVNKRKYLLSKQEIEFEQDTQNEIEQLANQIEEINSKIKSLRGEFKEYVFEINLGKILMCIKCALRKLYPNKEIKIITSTLSSEKQTSEGFYENRDYYLKTFLYGFEVDGKKFVLPEVKMEASYDYDSNDVIRKFNKNLITEELIGCTTGNFKEKEFQDGFWEIVEENLLGYVSNAIERYKKKKEEARKVLTNDLGNLLKTGDIKSIIDEENE